MLGLLVDNVFPDWHNVPKEFFNKDEGLFVPPKSLHMYDTHMNRRLVVLEFSCYKKGTMLDGIKASRG